MCLLSPLAAPLLALSPRVRSLKEKETRHLSKGPWFVPGSGFNSYTRLVYNRVPKTGSTTMINLTQALGKRNNFNVVVDDTYFPNATRLADIISNLPERTLYINHCNTWLNAPPDVGFFNMIRQPFEHDESFFYYAVDPTARPSNDVETALKKRRADPECGCYKVEYDHCIRLRNTNNCSLTFDVAHRRQFCDAPHHWMKSAKHTPKTEVNFWCDPVQTLKSHYLFVGLTEQYARSVATLERLLPDWFAGASELLAQMPQAKSTSERNELTGTVCTRIPRATSLRPWNHVQPLTSICFAS